MIYISSIFRTRFSNKNNNSSNFTNSVPVRISLEFRITGVSQLIQVSPRPSSHFSIRFAVIHPSVLSNNFANNFILITIFFCFGISQMVSPASKPTIVKKRNKSFKRHQSDRFKSVKESWRKPKGIDNRVRRRFSGQTPMPSIGYGSAKATKHMLPSGFRKVVIRNVSELEMLMMQNGVYAAEVAHNVSAKNRIVIVKRAKELNVKVTNPTARLIVAEAQ